MNILVTGGSRGIGKAAVDLFLRDGHSVTYTFNTSKVQETRPNCKAIHLNLEDPASLKAFEDMVRIGDFDGLVNNASPSLILKPLSKTNPGDLAQYVASGLNSFLSISKAFVEGRKSKVGSIVNILSSYTLGKGQSQLSSYITYKYALLGLHKCMAVEYQSKGITVNAVSPSMVETEFVTGVYPEKFIEMAREEHPLSKLASTEDVAASIKFLLCEARYVHGVNLPVTGGLL